MQFAMSPYKIQILFSSPQLICLTDITFYPLHFLFTPSIMSSISSCKQ